MVSDNATVGVVYILTNPSFSDYVKIGYASDMDERLAQLNRSECVPFAFRVYAVYEVTEPLQDRILHGLIDRLNPDLRAVEKYDGRTRVREFYAMAAEDAYALLYGIARLSGTEDRLHLLARSEGEEADETVAEQVRAEAADRRHRFRFSERGVPEGAEIAMIDRPDVRATVLDDNRIVCEDESGRLQTGTLAAFTRLHLGLDRVVHAFRYWSYDGVPLGELSYEG